MKFGDLVKSCNWLSIEMFLLNLYPEEKKNISGYEKVFEKLRFLQPKESDVSIVISREEDDFDQTEYIDVSGYYNHPEENEGGLTTSLALEFTPWNEWLGMDIDKDTLDGFSQLEIIAHCLYEMTFVGFDEEDIKEEIDRINNAAEEIQNMTEEEKRQNLKSWEDIKKEWDNEDNDKEKDK